MFDSVVK
jgi:hypothetical protein